MELKSSIYTGNLTYPLLVKYTSNIGEVRNVYQISVVLFEEIVQFETIK